MIQNNEVAIKGKKYYEDERPMTEWLVGAEEKKQQEELNDEETFPNA